jgi:hypothetical protein
MDAIGGTGKRTPAAKSYCTIGTDDTFPPRSRPLDRWTSSPFTELNGFSYHSNWLHNLLIASSMGGRRAQSRVAS